MRKLNLTSSILKSFKPENILYAEFAEDGAMNQEFLDLLEKETALN